MKIQLSDIKVNLPSSGKTLFLLKNFSVESGHKVLIEGESGKGKTTLLHLIAGLFYPEEGQVEIGTHKLNAMSDEERCRFRRAHVGMVFQKLNLIEHLTALENVCLSLGTTADQNGKAESALRSVGLKDQVHTRASVLSLGEQQRVAVARVLASNAQVILADEPTSSLDEKNSANVMDLLFEAAKGKTLLVVSHDHRIEKKFNNLVKFENLVQR